MSLWNGATESPEAPKQEKAATSAQAAELKEASFPSLTPSLGGLCGRREQPLWSVQTPDTTLRPSRGRVGKSFNQMLESGFQMDRATP